MLSAHVEMLTPFPGLDKQLRKKLHFPAAFFGLFFHVAEVGISLLERSGRGVPGSPQTRHPHCKSLSSAAPHSRLMAAEGLRPQGARTTKQWLLLCLPSRNLLSGGNNTVLNKKLLLFPIKQKLLPVNHLIPELCSWISLSLLLSLHLLLTILATHMSFNAVSLQNDFLIK